MTCIPGPVTPGYAFATKAPGTPSSSSMSGRSIWTPGIRRPRRLGVVRVIRYDRRGFGLSEGTPGRAADSG